MKKRKKSRKKERGRTEVGVGMDRRRGDSSDRRTERSKSSKTRDRAGARGLFDIGLCVRTESEERPKMSEIMRGKCHFYCMVAQYRSWVH